MWPEKFAVLLISLNISTWIFAVGVLVFIDSRGGPVCECA